MMKKAQESEAALRSLLASSEVGEVLPLAKGWAYRLFKNSGSRRWCDGCARGAALLLSDASQHTLGYVLHRALHI